MTLATGFSLREARHQHGDFLTSMAKNRLIAGVQVGGEDPSNHSRPRRRGTRDSRRPNAIKSEVSSPTEERKKERLCCPKKERKKNRKKLQKKKKKTSTHP